MKSERQESINGKLIQEFYWNGKRVVYVDHQLFIGSYEEALEKARKES